jgi:hypothetical protein
MKTIVVEIAYALPEKQTIISQAVPEGSSVQAAIELSGILGQYPMIDLTHQSVGIFNQVVSLETIVEAGDRIEIYRPLILDPMEARRQRAKKQRDANKIY